MQRAGTLKEALLVVPTVGGVEESPAEPIYMDMEGKRRGVTTGLSVGLHLCECSTWVSKAQESPVALLIHMTNVNKRRSGQVQR